MGQPAQRWRSAAGLRLFLPRLDPQHQLLLAAVASAAIYGLAYCLPYWLPAHSLPIKEEIYSHTAREPWRGALFYLAFGVLFGLYSMAWRLSSRSGSAPGAAPIVGLGAVVFCALLVMVQPITSSDVYGYVFQGRIVSKIGANPFAHFYRDFASDPWFSLVTFRNLPATTGYGPLWIAVEAGVGWLARENLLLNVLLLKSVAAGLHLASSGLVYRILRHTGPEQRVAGTLLFAWNPLLLWELAGNAHNDALVAALALLAALLLTRGAWWAAVPCLTAAALVKPVAILWLPLVAVWIVTREEHWDARLGRALAVGFLAFVTAAAGYLPFWAGPATLRGVMAQSNIHGNSLPSLLIQVWLLLAPGLLGLITDAVKLLTAAAFVPVYLRRMWLARLQPETAAFDAMLFYLLFVGLQFMPWYVSWLMMPAALLLPPDGRSRQELALLLSAAALLLYFPFGTTWARAHLSAAAVAALAALPIGGAVLWVLFRRPRTRPVPSPGQVCQRRP